MWQLRVKGTGYNEIEFMCENLDNATILLRRMQESSTCELLYKLKYVEVDEAEECERGEE